MKLEKNFIIIVIIGILLILGFLLLWFNYPTIKNLNFMSPEDQMKNDVQAIAGSYTFDMSELEKVEKIKSYGADVIPLLAEMIRDSRKETRYIAYIALSGLTNRLPDQRLELISYLKNGLTDSDDTIKVQVAQLLLVWGEKEAVPVLIEALDNDEIMVPSEPRTTLNYYAYLMLKDFTKADYQYNKQQWQNWWNKNQEKLTWDQEAEKFK